MNNKLRFRQVHLDFHTSPAITPIGRAFDRREFQRALQAGHVNSVTLFAKCHHGWSYYPTRSGRRHPGLDFDLLGEQVAACREIDVNYPIYLSAGWDNLMAFEHPEWRRVGPDWRYSAPPDVASPGWHFMCFNTPYLDHLAAEVREVAERFPDCHGIFLDIVSEADCCCRWCLEWMEQQGLDPADPAHRKLASAHALKRYFEVITAACRCRNPAMPVFHNSGHVTPGRRDLLPFFSHLELESLPTGGWGYDHFPLSARYVAGLELDYLGMTGKFHTTWGEFGGFKHPNALRYECAAMLAFGAKCSIGDQLHPDGRMDESTYAMIGTAYAEVAAKEPWCEDLQNVADIGLLLAAAQGSRGRHDYHGDTGAGRILLEGHLLFDALDCESDFSRYRLLILPDEIVIDDTLQAKLDAYLAQGGKLLLSGASGLAADGRTFLFDLGATCEGLSEFQPDYILPRADLRAPYLQTPLVTYLPSRRLRVGRGTALGEIFDPYFNRTARHFCSHQHAPYRPEPSGFACGVRQGNIVYLAHPVFTLYHDLGNAPFKEYVLRVILDLLGEPTLRLQGLPSTGRVSLTEQPAAGRHVLHLLYANTIRRGGRGYADGPNAGREALEVIEDLVPLRDVGVTLRLPQPPSKLRLVPQNQTLSFETLPDGAVRFTVPRLECHQMVELA